VVAGLDSPVWVTGGLAAAIVALDGTQHLYQFQEHWITYRSTAEALKHERYLYLAKVGTYAGEYRHSQLAVLKHSLSLLYDPVGMAGWPSTEVSGDGRVRRPRRSWVASSWASWRAS
jgi:hypothetical protein